MAKKFSKAYQPGEYPNGKNPCRGEVYWIEISDDEVVGHEYKKSRPFLVVSSDDLNKLKGRITMVPLTSNAARASLRSVVLIPDGDFAGSAADCGAIVSYAIQRLGIFKGTVDERTMIAIARSLQFVLRI